MAFGINTSMSSDDIVPILKYDARAGKFLRVDGSGDSREQVDITYQMMDAQKGGFICDFEQSLEVGYIAFRENQAPDFAIVPFGQPLPARPSNDHKDGIRLIVKLAPSCGGDVRELAGTAKAFLSGMEALHNEYVAQAAQNPGKLPVVYLKGTTVVKSAKSSNYAPVFAISRWANRPADLKPMPKTAAAPPAAAHTAPPSTGSTKAPPPVTTSEDEGWG